MPDPGDHLVDLSADGTLLDVGEVLLTELVRSAHWALAGAVQRALPNAEEPPQNFAAFGNAP